MNNFDAAYIAGFIDGEGTIALKTGKRYARDFVIRLRIVQCDYDVLFWIKSVFGFGTIYKRKLSKKINQKHWKQAWELSFNGREAMNVIHKIYPFLKVKRLQAEASFKFEQTMVGRGKILSQDQIKLREELRPLINSREKCGWGK